MAHEETVTLPFVFGYIKKPCIISCKLPGMSLLKHLNMTPSCQTLSKAFEI